MRWPITAGPAIYLFSFGQQQQQDSREVEIKSRRIDFNDARSPIIYTEKSVYATVGWMVTNGIAIA
jgi:preprotein translocase subunit Sec63